jgi:hypothetical protein
LAPAPVAKYTVRKELRLLAYEANPNKAEKIFKAEWAREDAEQIETATPGMRTVKEGVQKYLDEHHDLNVKEFVLWLKTLCHAQSLGRILLLPLADEDEESSSRKKTRPVLPENFGCRNIPLVFQPTRLLKTYLKICDQVVRKEIAARFQIIGAGKKTKFEPFAREDWEQFCETFRKPTTNGRPGPRVIKVKCTAGGSDESVDEGEDAEVSPTTATAEPELNASATPADEFVESTKALGTFLKGKSHKGYYVYLDAEGHWRRLPVFAHEKRTEAHEKFLKIQAREQAQPNSQFKAVGFLQTGCRVRLDKDVEKKGQIIARTGIYRLNTIKDDGFAKLTAQNGAKVLAQVELFIAAGLRRIYPPKNAKQPTP